MKIIIDIDEDIAQRIIDGKKDEPMNIVQAYPATIAHAIKEGVSLPKGHGNLIDKSNLHKAIYAEEDNCTGMGMTLEEMDAYNEGIDAMYNLVLGAKSIIEADKEEDKNANNN